jgi:hypothetical protein
MASIRSPFETSALVCARPTAVPMSDTTDLQTHQVRSPRHKERSFRRQRRHCLYRHYRARLWPIHPSNADSQNLRNRTISPGGIIVAPRPLRNDSGAPPPRHHREARATEGFRWRGRGYPVVGLQAMGPMPLVKGADVDRGTGVRLYPRQWVQGGRCRLNRCPHQVEWTFRA